MKYENLPNSLEELNRMKAALPEMQRAESQRIAQARADLEKEVEAFKADVPMIEDPEKEYKVKITFIKALIICGLLIAIAPLFFLEDEASAIAVLMCLKSTILTKKKKPNISWLVPILKPTKKRKQKNLPTKENVSCASASSS